MAVVRATFKPEFLNRLDDIILFDPLTTEELAEIVDLQVAALARRLAERRLTLHVTPAAREWLALTGFDPVYGARPLRRLVQSAIGDQLARALLAGDIMDGDTVLVDTRYRRRRAHGHGGAPARGSGQRLTCAGGCRAWRPRRAGVQRERRGYAPECVSSSRS